MPELANQADLAHVHLLINHFPTIGMILGLGLLLLSFIRKNDHLKKVSLEVLFLIALATIYYLVVEWRLALAMLAVSVAFYFLGAAMPMWLNVALRTGSPETTAAGRRDAR